MDTLNPIQPEDDENTVNSGEIDPFAEQSEEAKSMKIKRLATSLEMFDGKSEQVEASLHMSSAGKKSAELNEMMDKVVKMEASPLSKKKKPFEKVNINTFQSERQGESHELVANVTRGGMIEKLLVQLIEL